MGIPQARWMVENVHFSHGENPNDVMDGGWGLPSMKKHGDATGVTGGWKSAGEIRWGNLRRRRLRMVQHPLGWNLGELGPTQIGWNIAGWW